MCINDTSSITLVRASVALYSLSTCKYLKLGSASLSSCFPLLLSLYTILLAWKRASDFLCFSGSLGALLVDELKLRWRRACLVL